MNTRTLRAVTALPTSMFSNKPGASMMMRGPQVTRETPNDSGHDPEPAPAPEPEPAPAPEPAPNPAPAGPTDSEARLLRDVMKHKGAAQTAKAEADAARAALAAYGGVDPERVRELVAAAEAADRAEAERRGEYDRILAQVREQSETQLAAAAAQTAEAQERLAEAQRRIDELTLGRAFGDSKFLRENTLLSPSKARRLYEEHFDTVDGDLVAYDKPRGAKNRTPLVDARGDHLSFEAAIEKIVKADPDFETIGRAKIRSGANSAPSDGSPAPEPKAALKGAGLIAAALAKKKAK